jgi:hypothetical protein
LGVETTLLADEWFVGGGEIGGFGADIKRVVDFVAADCPAHAIWLAGFQGAWQRLHVGM